MKKILVKLLSLILAILLWLTVVMSSQNISEFKHGIPITIVNLAENQHLSSILPEVKIKVDAPIEILNTLDISDFNATIDVKGLVNGEFEKEINISSKNTKVRIVNFAPRKLKFTIEGFSKKTVPIKLILTGKVNSNYKILSSEIKEKFVQISAANSVLDNINEFLVNYDLNGESGDIEKRIKPTIKDKKGNILDIEFSNKYLNLLIKLEQVKLTKTVGVNPVFIGNVPENSIVSSVKVDPSMVKIYGDKSHLNNVDILNTEEINLADIKGGKKTFIRNLVIPNGLDVGQDGLVKITITLGGIDNSNIKPQ